MTPHRSAKYIHEHIIPTVNGGQLDSHVISHIDAVTISKALKGDANSYFYSAAISIADAIHGIRSNYYSWATVKLYYATFYCLRSLLGLDDYVVFYIHGKPRIVRARAGEQFKRPSAVRRAATTHGTVIETFKATNSSHYLLSQDIDNENPLYWLRGKREDTNYRSAKFVDPDVPEHFAILNNRTVRQLTAVYVDNGGINYEFDPDHAMLAFPIKAAQIVKQELESSGNYHLPTEQIDAIKRCFRDQDGALPKLQAIFD